MKHYCHWPKCSVEVPPFLWGCKRHWLKLPKNLRDAIYDNYRPGQEMDKRPSGNYIKVVREVRKWIKANE